MTGHKKQIKCAKKGITVILLTLCMALVCSLTACYYFPEFDEDTLSQGTEEDTSPASFDGQPYRFFFASNGDGTCYISFLQCNPDYPENVTLHFPDHSPSGETVTAIRYKTYYSSGVPVVIAAEDFEAHILKPLAQTFPDGENSFGYMKFCAYFSLKNPSAEIGDSVAELLQKYPITAVTPVYMLDLSCSVEEEAYLTDVLQGIGYDTRACRADYLHLAELVKASNAENKNEIFQSFPENPVYYTPNIVSMEFPEGLTEIDESVFAHCRGLTSIALPPCATEICDSSFLWCSDLSAVTVPDGVRRIGEYAFSSCSSLTEVTIPDSVTSIGAHAFSGCRSLNNVTIGRGVTSIGMTAFSGCQSLTGVIFKNTDGWYVSEHDDSASSRTDVAVTDAASAAEYLTGTYCEFFWERRE